MSKEKPNTFDEHSEFIDRIRNLVNPEILSNLNSKESFNLACDLLESDTEEYYRFMKHKLNQGIAAGIYIGIGISLIALFIFLVFFG